MADIYIKVAFAFSADNDIEKDILCSILGECGFDSFVSTDEGVDAFIMSDLYSPDAVDECLNSYPFTSIVGFTSSEIPCEDWNAQWEQTGYTPQYIDDCVVYGRQHSDIISPRKYCIEINPRQAFGTGHHETTTMMIRWLLSAPLSGKSVVDMGTGTGVLAILSEKLNAENIVAIEIDRGAYENAIENAECNNASKIQFLHGDASALLNVAPASADVMLANINRNILLADMEHYVRCLKSGGVLVLSGFYQNDIPKLEEEATRHNLTLVSTQELNDWAQVVFSKL